MSLILDQNIRDLFIQSVDKNFSLIAPAGVGKTQAIIDRLLSLATCWNGKPRGKVIIVTYTQKAAQQMRERAHAALNQLGEMGRLLEEEIYFGTLHSFAFHLLTTHEAMHIMPMSWKVIENKDQSWSHFCETTNPFQILDRLDNWEQAKRLVDYKKIWHLAQQNTLGITHPGDLPNVPRFDLRSIEGFKSEKKIYQKSIDKNKWILRKWAHNWENSPYPCLLPEIKTGGQDFIRHVQAILEPWYTFAEQAHLLALWAITTAYRDYRISHQSLLYDDIIPLAHQLYQHPDMQRKMDQQSYHIIVDEAQDLDTAQLELLLLLSGLKSPHGQFNSNQNTGRFVMVGDPQQSIYSQRASLSTYQSINQALKTHHCGKTLHLCVTFRCDQAIIDRINRWFNGIFSPEKNNPIHFNAFKPRPNIQLGSVSRFRLTSAQVDDGAHPSWQLAQAFAQTIQRLDLCALEIEDWSDIVCLCPRNDWLSTIAEALHQADIPHVLRTKRNFWGHQPAYAWLMGVVAILVHPFDYFEIAGVLREIFGFKDRDIADWVHSHMHVHPHPLALQPQTGNHPIEEALGQLYRLYHQTQSLSLGEIIQTILRDLDFPARLHALNTQIIDWDALENIKYEVAAHEAAGWNLRQLLSSWKNRAYEAVDVPPKKGCIQLMSCHAAKGLEWPVVILPYWFRPIEPKVDPYPRLIEKNGRSSLQLHASRVSEDFLYHHQQANCFEQQRLLYVSLTRAQKHLILVDDQAYFETHTHSFADTLQILPDQINHDDWQALPIFNHFTSQRSPLPVINTHQTSVLPQTFSTSAIEKAHLFCVRQLPSQTGNQQIHATSMAQPSNTQYGQAWHQMMEHMPWQATQLEWADYMNQSIVLFDDHQKAKHQQQLFLQSKLASIIHTHRQTMRTEVPFFWQASPAVAYDGVIDALFLDTSSHIIYIIDWKTNTITSMTTLIDLYQNQLSIYQQAVAAQFKTPVIGILYSSRLGQFIQIPHD